MTIRMLSSAVVAMLALSACATPPKWPWGAAGENRDWPCAETLQGDSRETDCEHRHATQAFLEASRYCTAIMRSHERSRTWFGSSQAVVSAVGAVSGSVIAPLAQGSAAQAWSGVSGVTNGMQTQMDKSFSGVLDIRRRQAVADAARAGADAVMAAQEPREQARRALQMALNCAMGAAYEDGLALQVLTSPSSAPMRATLLDDGEITIPYTYVDSDRTGRTETDNEALEAARRDCRRAGLGFTDAQPVGRPLAHCPADPRTCQVTARFRCVKDAALNMD